MNKVTITIDTDNDAFVENPGAEVARILEVVAGIARVYGVRATVGEHRDGNGNKVCKVEVTP